MKEGSRGRLYQDDHFVFSEFDGLQVEQLIVCENPETNNVCIVYLKVRGKTWHNYFLDAGFGFWEDWGETEVEEDEGYRYVDYTEKYKLARKNIAKIYGEKDENNCRIIIEFNASEKLILRGKDPKEFDGDSELVFVAS